MSPTFQVIIKKKSHTMTSKSPGNQCGIEIIFELTQLIYINI